MKSRVDHVWLFSFRTSGQTSANQNSSRSHAVFQIILRKRYVRIHRTEIFSANSEKEKLLFFTDHVYVSFFVGDSERMEGEANFTANSH